jgi:hypothetical protein
MDEGSAEDRDGGVVGIYLVLGMAADAGDGEVARYSNRSAPSSPVFLSRPIGFIIRRGGVRGGLEWNVGWNFCPRHVVSLKS